MKELTLSRRFRFESAHRLSKGFSGKCSNIHGHSFTGVVKYTSKSNGSDMATDFSLVGKIINEITEELDHSLILFEGDLLVDIFKHNKELVPLQIITLVANPTMETLVKYLGYKVRIALDKNNLNTTYIKGIELRETENNSIYYEPIDIYMDYGNIKEDKTS